MKRYWFELPLNAALGAATKANIKTPPIISNAGFLLDLLTVLRGFSFNKD